MDTNPLVNKGVIIRPGNVPPGESNAGRTFIISGVGRGGTTMLASVLRTAGLRLGVYISEVTGEDLEVFSVLRDGSIELLEDLITHHNREYRDWGFKVPNIQAFLNYKDLDRFRNPHLILVFRDPIAIAVRGSIADHIEPWDGVRDNAVALTTLVEFAQNTNCPCLLVSYEKALIFPELLIDTLAAFCALPINEALRAQMVAQINPNSANYVENARRRFAGVVEFVDDGVLTGWCAELGELAPIELDLFIDEHRVLTFKANEFRPDLASAGYGNGNHGFAVTLRPLTIDPHSVVRVRVSGKTFEVLNSGRPICEYPSAAN